jgi:hypothetical protein
VGAAGRDAEVHVGAETLAKLADDGGVDAVHRGAVEPRSHACDRPPIHGPG